jgi:hypothetical protein
MPVSINGNTGVITGLAVGGLPDGTIDADSLASNAVTSAKLASGVGGKILQVGQSVITGITSFSTGSSTISDSYFDISGLSVSLTPASGTKILVSYTVNTCGQAGHGHGLALLRGNTSLYRGDSAGNKQRLSNWTYTQDNNQIYTLNGQFLDTHGANGSTAVTYKLQMYVGTPGYTVWVNRSGTGESDTRAFGRTASQITVQEVAA